MHESQFLEVFFLNNLNTDTQKSLHNIANIAPV